MWHQPRYVDFTLWTCCIVVLGLHGSTFDLLHFDCFCLVMIWIQEGEAERWGLFDGVPCRPTISSACHSWRFVWTGSVRWDEDSACGHGCQVLCAFAWQTSEGVAWQCWDQAVKGSEPCRKWHVLSYQTTSYQQYPTVLCMLWFHIHCGEWLNCFDIRILMYRLYIV